MSSSPSPAFNLGYLVLEVARPDAWKRFCADVLGLPTPARDAAGRLAWQIDDRAQRLVAEPGPRDDLAAMGFCCGDDDVLDALLARLAAAGHTVTTADEALRRARRVRRLHCTVDPDGNAVELCTGLEAADRPFVSTAFPDGFCTGDDGFGHAALVTHDVAAMERFYVDALGFAVTERLATRVGPIDVRGVFLHCNRRHHTLALFDLPIEKRLHHFMLQAPNVRDIGVAHERARRFKVPMSLGLGQHPAPESTFSFYGATPSGFDFEIGAGTQSIEPAHWEVRHTQQASAWGHKPHLRMQVKMAGGLLRQKLRGRRVAPGAG
jgi:2,3-dihydroxybiphenyl 1,2-dioxygenase